MGEASQQRSHDTELFLDVFNASPIGIAVENLEGQPLFVNRAFCSMLGFSEEELRGKHCVDFSPPEDAQQDWALFQQLQAGAIDHYQMEKRYFRKDGSLFWGNLSISLLNSRPSSLVLALVQDITEKKMAEEARFRHTAIVESSDDAIASGTLDGIIVSWNSGAEKLYGYTEAEAIGKPISMLVPPELPDEENKILEKLRTGGRIENFETVRITKTGKRISVSLSICPIKDRAGATVGVSGIARDITERKRTGEALRKSEERYRLAALAGRMFAYEWDAITDVIVRLGDFAQVLGNEEPIETTGQKILMRIHRDDRERVTAAIANLSSTNSELKINYRMERRDGSFMWVERNSRADFDEQGRMLRLVGMITDISERRRIEEALANMTRTLVEAQDQERARIARELHDDINQRLAMLAIELEELQDDRSEFRSRLQELRKQAIEISNDVQALSHDLHSTQLDYLGVVAGIESWCKEFGARHGMQVDYRHDVQSALRQEVGLCLFRVLQEALHNAVKHSGVKRTEVRLQEELGEIHLVVHDSGKGFDIGAVKRDRGLGLTSMRERIRLVNGTIDIQSKPMDGTTIHVRVPLEFGRETQRAAE